MTMQKTYQAKTDISINVRINGCHRHLRFIPMTLGGSFLTTDDEDVQQAIERHHKFGCQIVLLTEPEPVKEVPAVAPTEVEKVSFYSLADAKEYLASRFGVSRTRLRTSDQIYELAEKNHLHLVVE